MKKLIAILLAVLLASACVPLSAAAAKGDLDGDGGITVADALAALRVAAKLADETDEVLTLGDVDGDGSVTVADALAILRVAAKLAEPFPEDATHDPHAMEEYMLELINTARAEAGVRPLAFASEAYHECAQTRADELVEAFNAEHNRPDGRVCFTVLTDRGLPFYAAGENIDYALSYGRYSSPEDIDKPMVERLFNTFMNSPPHKGSILSADFTHVGVAFAVGTNAADVGAPAVFCEQLFYA